MSGELVFHEETFTQVIERYKNLVHAVTFSLTGNLQQSEDLAQETFVTAWQKRNELRESSKLPAWLCGIARNLSKKWLRDNHKTLTREIAVPSEHLETLPDLAALDTTPDGDTLDREEAATLVWETLRRLPESYREPLMMFYRHGTSVRDIAAALELSEDAVKQRLSRGRSQLKEAVERQVEHAIETIRVREHFGIAVLAAIPIAATAPEIFAATSAASTAGVAAKSSGGVPLLASIGAYFQSLLTASFFPLVMLFGVFSGSWGCVTNAPTLRSRRFLCQVVLFHGMVYFTWCFLTIFRTMVFQLLPLNAVERQALFLVSVASYAFQFLMPLYCVVTAIIMNRIWRRIVLEDMRGNIQSSAKPTPESVKRFLTWCIAIPLLALLTCVGFAWIFESVFEKSFISHIWRSSIIGVTAIALMIAFYFIVRPRFQNEASLVKHPPRVGNYLAVLAGEEKPRTGYRHRVCFWGDTIMIGLVLVVLVNLVCVDSLSKMQGFFGTFTMQSMLEIAVGLLFALLFAGYLVFAVFFSGIPRRRYWGFILLAVWLALLFLPYHFMIEPWLLHDDLPTRSFFPYIPLFMCEYIICLALVGIAGLWVFRRAQ